MKEHHAALQGTVVFHEVEGIKMILLGVKVLDLTLALLWLNME